MKSALSARVRHVLSVVMAALIANVCCAPHASSIPILPMDTIVATEVAADGRAAGRIDGAFSVTSDGAATYTVPLWVPEGRGSMKPNLALIYQSRGGDGPLGVGWSLGGLSSISRCQ